MDRSPPRPRAPPNTPTSTPSTTSGEIELQPNASPALISSAATSIERLQILKDVVTDLHISLSGQYAQVLTLYVELGHQYYSIIPFLSHPDQVHAIPRTALRNLFSGSDSDAGTSNSFMDHLSSVSSSFRCFRDGTYEQMSEEEWKQTGAAFNEADDELDDLKDRLVAAEFHLEVLRRLTENARVEGRELQGGVRAEREIWQAGIRAVLGGEIAREVDSRIGQGMEVEH